MPGTALDLDGGSFYSYNRALTGDRTFQFWVKLTGTINNLDTVIGCSDTGGDGAFLNFWEGQLRIYASSSDLVISSHVLAPDTWTHYTVVLTASSSKISVNGGATVNTGSGYSTTTVARIGSRGLVTGETLLGQLDDLRIYERALGDAEISTNYNQHIVSDANLVASFDFESDPTDELLNQATAADNATLAAGTWAHAEGVVGVSGVTGDVGLFEGGDSSSALVAIGTSGLLATAGVADDVTTAATTAVTASIDVVESQDGITADASAATPIDADLNAIDVLDGLQMSGQAEASAALSVSGPEDSASASVSADAAASLTSLDEQDASTLVAATAADADLSTTDYEDAISASGSAGDLLSGDLGITEQDDAGSGTSGVAVSGSVTAIDGPDTAASSGAVSTSGAATATNSPDAISADGGTTDIAIGTLSVSDAPDVITGAGLVDGAGSLSVSDSADSITATGSPEVSGSSVTVYQPDSVDASASPQLAAGLSLTEPIDAAQADGSTVATVTAGLESLESEDGITASAGSEVSSDGDSLESQDVASATGAVDGQGSLALSDAPDGITADGSQPLPAGADLSTADTQDTLTGGASLDASADLTKVESDGLELAASPAVSAAITVQDGDDMAAGGASQQSSNLFSNLVPIMPRLNAIAGRLGANPFRVTAHTRTSSAGNFFRGEVSNVTAASFRLLEFGQNPAVTFRRQEAISRGVPEDTLARVGPITPAHTGGGYDPGHLRGDEGEALEYQLTGPGMSDVRFAVESLDTSDPLGMYLDLRRI